MHDKQKYKEVKCAIAAGGKIAKTTTGYSVNIPTWPEFDGMFAIINRLIAGVTNKKQEEWEQSTYNITHIESGLAIPYSYGDTPAEAIDNAVLALDRCAGKIGRQGTIAIIAGEPSQHHNL